MDHEVSQERVSERAQRLYEDGYRAAPIPWAPACPEGVFLVITPGGDAYTVDSVAQSCSCASFPFRGYCKHALGLPALLRAQERARKVRRELRQQAGCAPVTAADAGPAPELPLAQAPTARTRTGPSAARLAADFGASPAETRSIAQR